MDFNLSKEHQMAQQLFRDFAHNEVAPWAEEQMSSIVFPGKLFGKCKVVVSWNSLCQICGWSGVRHANLHPGG
jgi:hypothetical protein